jgi:hypothetical protein
MIPLALIGIIAILAILVMAMFNNSDNWKFASISLLFSIALVALLGLLYLSSSPQAIDVYRGKTTLEYTVKDGVKTDSVVVFKDKEQ